MKTTNYKSSKPKVASDKIVPSLIIPVDGPESTIGKTILFISVATAITLIIVYFIVSVIDKRNMKFYVSKAILKHQLEIGECKEVAFHDGFKYVGKCEVTDETLRNYNESK